MATTKVFRSGNSQAVRIPRKFHLTCKRVEIFRKGADLVIREKPHSLAHAYALLTRLSSDFFAEGRQQPKPQKRARL